MKNVVVENFKTSLFCIVSFNHPKFFKSSSITIGRIVEFFFLSNMKSAAVYNKIYTVYITFFIVHNLLLLQTFENLYSGDKHKRKTDDSSRFFSILGKVTFIFEKKFNY